MHHSHYLFGLTTNPIEPVHRNVDKSVSGGIERGSTFVTTQRNNPRDIQFGAKFTF